MKEIDIQTAIQGLQSKILTTDSDFIEYHNSAYDYNFPWRIDSCFLQLLALLEILELPEMRKMALQEYLEIKNSENGFYSLESTDDGLSHSLALGRIICYLNALKNIFMIDSTTIVNKDILEIIRNIHYVITDTKVFHGKPRYESDVHQRIESILKCVFPDLKHKPTLTKQIKNFEPDTGIQSINTLIEYKYLSRSENVSRIADEVLADTRGYTSPEWKRFIYVIYETSRIRPESEWNLFLRQSKIPKNTCIVVLSGEPA